MEELFETYLTFSLGKENFAINVEQVEKILEYQRANRSVFGQNQTRRSYFGRRIRGKEDTYRGIETQNRMERASSAGTKPCSIAAA